MLVLQGRLKTGEWLLVNGVSSGVGVSSLQLRRALGANVIGTSGSADKLAALAPLGVDVAVRTRWAGLHASRHAAARGRGAALRRRSACAGRDRRIRPSSTQGSSSLAWAKPLLPVIKMTTSTLVLAVNPATGIRSLPELIATAKTSSLRRS